MIIALQKKLLSSFDTSSECEKNAAKKKFKQLS